ncbi:MAG: hypothetical protein ABL917_02010, partial [Parcubacteria group bacterium]
MSLFEDKKEEVSLLVDIGNSSITAAFLLFSSDKLPNFLYTVKTDFIVSDKPNATQLLETMNRVLEDTLSYMMKYGFEHNYWKYKHKKLDNLFVSFSSPWFIPKNKHIHLSQDKTFIISDAFLNDIRDKEEEIFKKELTDQFHGNDTDSFQVIEKSIVQIKINGYSVEDVMGVKTKMFDAYLCMSVINDSVMTRVYNTILKNTSLPKENVLAHTFPLVSFSVFRDIYPDFSSFIIMDITGEVTDMTMVQNEVIVGTTSFPFGSNYMIRKISQVLNLPPEVAESTLHMYLTKKLDNDLCLSIENILSDIEKEWAIYLENSLLELSPELILPSRMYITVDGGVFPVYMNFLKLHKSDATSTFRKNLDIVHINEEIMAKFYTKSSMI